MTESRRLQRLSRVGTHLREVRRPGRGCRHGRRPGRARAPSRSSRRRYGRTSCAARSRSHPAAPCPVATPTTRSPTAKFSAPHTIPRGSPVPTSTWHQRMVLPFECVSSSYSRTRPTTSGPDTSAPTSSMASSFSPSMVSRAATSWTDASGGIWTWSRSHENGTRIRAPSRTATVNRTSPSTRSRMSLMPLRIISVRSMPIPNANPLYRSGSTPAATQDPGVDDAAATPLDPTLATAGAAGQLVGLASLAYEAQDVHLDAGLGEGEVRRPEPGHATRPEDLGREMVQGALEVSHRDAAVDGQPLHLVEHRGVAGVELVGPERAARTYHVHRQVARQQAAHLHRRRVRPQHQTGPRGSRKKVSCIVRAG